MAINQNWNLGKRAAACCHSEKAFEDGETLVTAVVPVPDSDDFERRDYSVEAWEAVKSELGPFSFWRSKFEVPPPPVKKEEVVEKESAEALLHRLLEEDDPKTENARYVLAVMLERKKTLKEVEKKDAENGSRLLIYEHVKTGEVLIVRDPMLHLDEVEPVQAEVSALLAARPTAKAVGEDGESQAGDDDTRIESETQADADTKIEGGKKEEDEEGIPNSQ